MTRPFIKVCGVREQTVLKAAIEAGVAAIGLNFVPSSRRAVTVDQARGLVDWAASRFNRRPVWVGVFANQSSDEIARVRARVGLDLAQLHGHETVAEVEAAQPGFKAIRVGTHADLAEADRFSGPYLLIDARVSGQLGGTGQRIPLELVRRATTQRAVVVAGGLDAANVGEVIDATRPAGVDTASGAEDVDGAPSAEAARQFVLAAQAAFDRLEEESSDG